MNKKDKEKIVTFWNVGSLEEAKYDRVSTRKEERKAVNAFDASVVNSLITDHILKHKRNITKKDRVLDFGCGVGRILKGFHKFESQVYGTDISENMLSFCKEELGSFKVNLKKCNVGSVPFGDDFFDIIYSFHVLQHIATKKLLINTLREIYRTQKPGGIAVLHFIRKVSESDKEFGGFAGFRPSRDTAVKICKKIGYELIDIDAVEGGAFILHLRK